MFYLVFLKLFKKAFLRFECYSITYIINNPIETKLIHQISDKFPLTHLNSIGTYISINYDQSLSSIIITYYVYDFFIHYEKCLWISFFILK